MARTETCLDRLRFRSVVDERLRQHDVTLTTSQRNRHALVRPDKGDGETHPFLSPDDEFADFETMDAGNLNGTTAKTPEMLSREYARSALMEGLRLEARLGTNPYKFGMVGSSDNHTALPTTREENNFSKASFVEPSADRFEHALVQGAAPELSIFEVDVGAAGLAAVWARENTRESIWDAMARKEHSPPAARA